MSELRPCICGHPHHSHALTFGIRPCEVCDCEGYREVPKSESPMHPAVEVLDELEREIVKFEWSNIGCAFLLHRIAELRKAKGV